MQDKGKSPLLAESCNLRVPGDHADLRKRHRSCDGAGTGKKRATLVSCEKFVASEAFPHAGSHKNTANA